MLAHDRPHGRPIHPECPASRRADAPCECHALWAGWDGTESSLQDRIAVISAREARRRDLHGAVVVDEEDLRGYWRESERLQSALVNLTKAS